MNERLFQLAYEIRKLKPWKKIAENELFGFEHEGEVFYCSVMGALGEHLAVGFYRGISGLKGLEAMVTANEALHHYEVAELGVRQDCLMCSFVCKDDGFPEQIKEFTDFCKREGLRIGGTCAYPLFERMVPYKMPEPINAQGEEEIIIKGLTVTLERLEERFKLRLPQLPMYSEDGWRIEQIPELPCEVMPEMDLPDEFTMFRIRKNKNGCVWAMKLLMLPAPVLNEEENYFPFGLVIMDVANGYLLPPIVEKDLKKINIDDILMENGIPSTVQVFDERTEHFLKKYMQSCGVNIVFTEDNEEFEEVLNDMLFTILEHAGSETDELDEMFENMEDVPDDVLLGAFEMFGSMMPQKWIDELIDRGLIDD